MPTQEFGLYPAEGTLGDQVSSTYEGRHVTLYASEINHGNVLTVVTKGYPVIFGTVAGNHGVGIALKTEVAGTDLIAIDTEGVWNVSVVATDDLGASLVTGGDPLYINTTTAVVSKIRNNATQIPFGYALGQVAAAATAVIAVKVHWDPRSHWLEDKEMLYFGDARDVNIEFDGANLVMLPLVNDTGAFNIGNGTLSMDFQVFGMTANDYMLYDNSIARLSLINTALVDAGRIASMHGTVATPAYGDGYGMVELDLAHTGVATSQVAALSVWINMTTGTANPGNDQVVTPITTGLYVPGAAEVLNGDLAYGMRCQAILTDSDFKWLACISTNITQVQTAIFHTNSQPNFGLVAGVHAGGVTGSIPLVCAIDGGSVKWVRVYDAAA